MSGLVGLAFEAVHVKVQRQLFPRGARPLRNREHTAGEGLAQRGLPRLAHRLDGLVRFGLPDIHVHVGLDDCIRQQHLCPVLAVR